MSILQPPHKILFWSFNQLLLNLLKNHHQHSFKHWFWNKTVNIKDQIIHRIVSEPTCNLNLGFGWTKRKTNKLLEINAQNIQFSSLEIILMIPVLSIHKSTKLEWRQLNEKRHNKKSDSIRSDKKQFLLKK